MLASSVFEQVRALLSELTDDGTTIPDADVADIQAKFLKFINMGQRELFNIGGMEKTFEFAHKPVINLLGEQFEIVEYEGTTQYYPNENGVTDAKSYYFEADSELTLEIQENQSDTWVTLTTVSVPSTVTSFTSYKGLITATGNVRMKISGSYYAKHRNRALFKQPFKVDRIPVYKPYTKIELPSDFNSIDKVVKEYPIGQYTAFSDYKMEGKDGFYIDWYFEGNIRIIYNPIPVEITALTDTIQVDDIQSDALVYFIASKIAVDGYQELVNFTEQLYNEKIAKISQPEVSTIEQVEDVYGGFEVR